MREGHVEMRQHGDLASAGSLPNLSVSDAAADHEAGVIRPAGGPDRPCQGRDLRPGRHLPDAGRSKPVRVGAVWRNEDLRRREQQLIVLGELQALDRAGDGLRLAPDPPPTRHVPQPNAEAFAANREQRASRREGCRRYPPRCPDGPHPVLVAHAPDLDVSGAQPASNYQRTIVRERQSAVLCIEPWDKRQSAQ